MELLILSVVTLLILYRLYTILGSNAGITHKAKSKHSPHNNSTTKKQTIDKDIDSIPSVLHNAINSIRKKDPNFTISDFLYGATEAFEIILDQYCKGNLANLAPLVAKDILNTFKTIHSERTKQNISYSNTLVKIESTTISDVKIKNNTAHIQVKYASEQIITIKDKDGKIIEGSDDQIERVVDFWTFSRTITTNNPNWVLTSIKQE